MTPEIQLQLLQLAIIIATSVAVWMNTRNRRTDASTAVIAADAKQANAVTELALMNYEERKALSESVSVVRDKLSYLQGQYDKEQQTATKKIDGLESQMKELGTNYEARIHGLETEITGLNKIIAARDETIAELKNQVKTLSETVEKFLLAQTTIPPVAQPNNIVTPGVIPIELTVKGGITATSPLETNVADATESSTP